MYTTTTYSMTEEAPIEIGYINVKIYIRKLHT